MHCNDVVQFIARRADGDDSLDAQSRASLDAHLEGCASCRAALDTQRVVSALLRLRPADRVSPGFAARLASRIDDASGWFGIADWRAWTLRLTPVAAALALVVYLGFDAATQTAITIEEWTLGVPDTSAAALLWQSDVTPESVLETMLTGELPAAADGAAPAAAEGVKNVR